MPKSELLRLYEETNIIASYIYELDKNKPEIIPGMKEISLQLFSTIKTTFDRKDLRGLKLINSDFKEMASNLNKSEYLGLQELLAKSRRKNV